MPYCVNCGVELTRSAKQCPLCNAKVVLPVNYPEPTAGSSLPVQRDPVATAFDKNLWIQVVSVLMIIPALICVVINAAFGEGLTWSLYVIAGFGTAWVWCVSPFLYRRNIVPLWIALDAAALLGLLYVVNALAPTPGWFVPLALPITLCLTMLLLLIVELARRRILQAFHKVTATLIAISLFFMVVEGAVDLYLTGVLKLQWSLLILVVCLPVALIAAILQRRQAIVEGMRIWLRM